MADKVSEIFAKNKDDIFKKIEIIEENIFGIKFSKEGLQPNKEQKSNLQERMKFYNVPGLSIAVINNFKVEWTKCYGVRDNRTKEKITLDTLFEAGSTSKTFTAVIAMILVEKGLIDLDEEVNIKLKKWKIPENQFTAEEKITLRHILTHTSGINRPDSMFSFEEESYPTLDNVLNGEKPALNDPVEVVFQPGSNHQYSNLGYSVIQKLVEDITRKKFHQIAKEYVFNPLKMKNSSFEFPSEEVQRNSIVHHDKDGVAKGIGLHPE